MVFHIVNKITWWKQKQGESSVPWQYKTNFWPSWQTFFWLLSLIMCILRISLAICNEFIYKFVHWKSSSSIMAIFRQLLVSLMDPMDCNICCNLSVSVYYGSLLELYMWLEGALILALLAQNYFPPKITSKKLTRTVHQDSRSPSPISHHLPLGQKLPPQLTSPPPNWILDFDL
jgi:hypothetical protein